MSAEESVRCQCRLTLPAEVVVPLLVFFDGMNRWCPHAFVTAADTQWSRNIAEACHSPPFTLAVRFPASPASSCCPHWLAALLSVVRACRSLFSVRRVCSASCSSLQSRRPPRLVLLIMPKHLRSRSPRRASSRLRPWSGVRGEAAAGWLAAWLAGWSSLQQPPSPRRDRSPLVRHPCSCRLRVSEAAGRKKPSGVNLPVIHSAAFQCTNQHTHSDACFVGVAAHLTASRA